MFSIRRYFSVHDSGTKFYQGFVISRTDQTKAVAALHYGSYKLGDFPKAEGHTLTTSFHEQKWAAVSVVAAKIADKKKPKKGEAYREWQEVQTNYPDILALEKALYEMFGGSVIKIVAHLATPEGASITDEIAKDTPPSDLPEVKVDTEEMHPHWGTW